MWQYEKILQYPVNIKRPNPTYAKIILAQYGGPDGELSASLRYLSQRFSMPYPELRGLLTDIGTEELAHLEMVGAIVYQLTRNLSPEEIKEYFLGNTLPVLQSLRGWCAVLPQGVDWLAGYGKAVAGTLKNHLPKGLRG